MAFGKELSLLAIILKILSRKKPQQIHWQQIDLRKMIKRKILEII